MKEKRGSKGQFNMCRRKKRYTARAGYRTVDRVSTNGTAPRVYRCPFCGQFHIGRLKEKFKKFKKKEIYEQS